MSEIRNPEYPEGMTMRELIGQSEGPNCHWCHRPSYNDANVLFKWTDELHDGMCPVPFMREAQRVLDEELNNE